MEFSGTFELEGATLEEVWLALSDPVMLKNAAPGCQFLVEIEDEPVDFDAIREREAEVEDLPMLPDADPDDVIARAVQEGSRYAALVEISVGSVKPSFESVVTIEKREFPRMEASGEGNDPGSSFEMYSWMELSETETGVKIDWGSEAEVFGRIAQMGQRVINPVTNRVANQFFQNVENQLNEIEHASKSIRDRIRDLV